MILHDERVRHYDESAYRSNICLGCNYDRDLCTCNHVAASQPPSEGELDRLVAKATALNLADLYRSAIKAGAISPKEEYPS